MLVRKSNANFTKNWNSGTFWELAMEKDWGFHWHSAVSKWFHSHCNSQSQHGSWHDSSLFSALRQRHTRSVQQECSTSSCRIQSYHLATKPKKSKSRSRRCPAELQESITVCVCMGGGGPGGGGGGFQASHSYFSMNRPTISHIQPHSKVLSCFPTHASFSN